MKKSCLVGDTPLVKINYLYEVEERHIYAKLEYFNITGSIKDRLVYYVLDKANLSENVALVEATSGNTGIALASYGARYNHPVYIFMPDYVSNERIKLLEMFGAKVTLISKEEGGFKESVRRAKEFQEKNNCFLLNQFNNVDNVKCHYNTTGLELVRDLKHIDKFISGVGSGGTLMGVGSRLKETFGTKIIAIEPKELPILSDSEAIGSHKIDGIGDDFVPDIVDTNFIDEIISISDKEAIEMARKFACELGLGIGISSAANFLASVKVNKNNEEVVTIFADDNKKYLSTFLEFNNEKSEFVNKIKLVSLEIC